MKKLSQLLQKFWSYIRVWGNDYTFGIYLAKVFGYILSVLYFIGTRGNKAKTKEFNQKRNYFVRLRREKIEKYYAPENKTFDEKFLCDAGGILSAQGDRYNFRGIFLPKIQNTYLLRMVYADTLKVWTEFNDNYDYSIVDELDKSLPEGTYCYTGKNGEDISIKPGDIVVDAGAWIGDFSAYAAKKGAHAYAFEPSPRNIEFLKKTISLNSESNVQSGGSIRIIPFGLGEKEETMEFFENDSSENTGGNSFNISQGSGNTKLSITTLDTWVVQNNIPRVDFIKADIEGYERHMLRGATSVLQKFEPILSLCTYHFPEDPQVLKEIILKANPRYTIIQRKMKLFAFVDKNSAK